MSLSTLKNWGTFLIMSAVLPVHASISLDRTRVIFDGDQKSISLNIRNSNRENPYLAQAWIEDKDGNKIMKPFIMLPPVQRVEAGESSQVKIQALSDAAMLPQDRETLYYFNLREIPPRSNKANVLQLALQTRVKMFYRPVALVKEAASIKKAWQSKLTVEKRGSQYVVINPTPFYVTLVSIERAEGESSIEKFSPLLIEPNGEQPLGLAISELGQNPMFTYISDYGGHRSLPFICDAMKCQINHNKY